jgi:hypothetical protein
MKDNVATIIFPKVIYQTWSTKKLYLREEQRLLGGKI